ncbi:hypothetical protein [Aliivibrio fischeri]|uniref:hypothetical protein n=1 Tax=Aliivibrio fischeri TaxID=668 RepID=UPI00080E6ED4|nr:hypothetical protein [Aliivibrio fischeri]OCH43076.1 hypothetical protein A6D99_00410 [Aliivibrio fischeri]
MLSIVEFIIIHGLCLLSFCVLLMPRWRQFGQRASVDENLSQVSLHNCIRMQPFAISLGLVALIDNLSFFAVLAFSLPLIALFVPVYVGVSKKSTLVVERHWFHVDKARLHFIQSEEAPFNCDDFYELLALLNILKKGGVRKVYISSPLFFKQDQVREFPYMKAQLNRKGIVTHSYTSRWGHFPFMMIELFYLKYIKQSPYLKSVSIIQWRTVIFHL